MTDKKFNAILAKNHIARELKQADTKEDLSIDYIVSCLRDIEAYLGQANQPSVDDIINSDMDI